MLENSIQNATFVAYNHTDKKITIKDTKNIVVATTKENGIEIGDILLSVDNQEIKSIAELKRIVEYQDLGQCEFQDLDGTKKCEKEFWERNYRKDYCFLPHN